jgi:uncharacterized protein (TIGR03437 family)
MGPARANRLPKSAALLLFMAAAVPASGQIQILSITSSANFVPGLLQPGGLASIFCTGLQDIAGVIVAQEQPLPHMLAGVKVTVNGVEAPILAIAQGEGGAYQQINLQIPWATKNTSGMEFEVSQKGAYGHGFPVGSGDWPVFFVDSTGYGIAQHGSDYRPVTARDPAKPGEWIVVYATNLGPVQNQPADGLPVPPDVLAPVVPDPSPYLSYYGVVEGSFASYLSKRLLSNYIGMAPGTMIDQVNLLVPSSQADGDLVFQILKVYDCGFFFTHGCGRGFTTVAASMPAKIPVAR